MKSKELVDKKAIGKKSRRDGKAFEKKVRMELESKGWIVAKWTNNVEFLCQHEQHCCAKLIAAKNKFLGPGRPMMLGAGFPDFICYKKIYNLVEINPETKERADVYEVIGVEAKMNGYLDQVEKEKCSWLIDNNIFSKILVASKSDKKGEINYKEFSSP